ncbi:hypothetical protein AK812_SmicGene43287 [Symbiodinium microadriaticum]|uniref:Uncharacterized protein n=1 Tax=Symbiodinium microadriaticum TaxID=2951 RepID=A0A1Q9C1F8_SYMMI|nr:hypothetical protein AK812_SmicGene43287 [Symbiodinium microadriaticum]
MPPALHVAIINPWMTHHMEKAGYGAAILQLSARSREMREEEPESEEPAEEEPQESASSIEAEASTAEEGGSAPETTPLSAATDVEDNSDSDSFDSLPGLADTVLRRRAVCLENWEGWPAAMALSAARRLAENPRGAAAASLQAAARAFSFAGEHALAAELLLSLRDGGVDREVLQRRLDVGSASALFEEVAVRAGLELQAAGYFSDAWEALMAASAQPDLRKSFRKPTLKALALVSERLCNDTSTTPKEQVKYLRGALDAEVVLQGLARDRKEGLELFLALSLEKAGRLEESKRLLEDVARRGTSRRKRQAEWALLVQDADVGTEPPESAVEMRSIWGQVEIPGSRSGRGTGTGRAMMKKSKAPFFQSSEFGMAVATAVLALPLALPLILTQKP